MSNLKNSLLVLVLLLFTTNVISQLKGKVTDSKGLPIPFVTVLLENTNRSTTTNEEGKFEFSPKIVGKSSLIFKYIGYKTVKKEITTQDQFFEIQMVEEEYVLNEVVISKKNDPALEVIKNAIATRKENAKKTEKFNADFYSRGLFKLQNLPKKIMGMKIDIGDLETNLDSTGSGIIYLSETVSKISYEKPNRFNEKIIASKISGNDKGFSYNTAKSSFYDFYDNSITFEVPTISPIANNALGYYKYKLEGTFYDENNFLINKIKVTPRRDKEPVYEGYIYIVEDSWAIYAIDLTLLGYRIKREFTESITLKQNFIYSKPSGIWSKNSQSLAFIFGGFGIKYLGKINYVYSNYDFVSEFDAKTFGKEILSFEKDSNKKEGVYWEQNRPIPLTDEETEDYIKKEKLQLKRTSKTYLDSIDSIKNKFKFSNLLMGYQHKKSFEKISYTFLGFINPPSGTFNTVQGYVLGTGFKYFSEKEEIGKETTITGLANYGFSENKLRLEALYDHTFNNQSYDNLKIGIGSKAFQFNNNNPINSLVNTVSSLCFKNNFMKLYQGSFATIQYSSDIANGVNLLGKIEFQDRKSLFNTSNESYFFKNDIYSSNNPLQSEDYLNSGIENHQIAKLFLKSEINFRNTFFSRPDGKFNIRNKRLPVLFLEFEKGITASAKKYTYSLLAMRSEYRLNLDNKGKIEINAGLGKFLNAKNISFLDYKHFAGNQSHIGTTNNMSVFNNMHYYSNSTKASYFEWHSEYDDAGFIMNKIPLLNKLKSNLVIGFHNLGVPERKPYREFTIGLDTIGFGKLKIFRLDYIRSYQNGFINDGIIIGTKLLIN